jgi:hypothetical protein
VRDSDLYREIEKFYALNWTDVGKGTKDLRIRCFVLIEVEEALPLTSPSYDDGADEREIRREWIEYFDSLNRKLERPKERSTGDRIKE